MRNSQKNVIVPTGLARVNPVSPVGLNGQSKERMGCGVSKVIIFHPEPNYYYDDNIIKSRRNRKFN